MAQVKEKDITFLNTLIKQGKVAAYWNLGYIHEKDQQYQKALNYYTIGADDGCISCAIEAAKYFYNNDHGIKQDLVKSLAFLDKAYQLKPLSSLTNYNLGLYYMGFYSSEKKNIKKARYHFALAAFLGDVDAASTLVNNTEISAVNSARQHLGDVINESGFRGNKLVKRLEALQLTTKAPELAQSFSPSFGKNTIILRDRLTKENAQGFGQKMSMIQSLIYVDPPLSLTQKSHQLLNKMMVGILFKHNSVKNFTDDRLIHELKFTGRTRKMVYTIKILGKND